MPCAGPARRTAGACVCGEDIARSELPDAQTHASSLCSADTPPRRPPPQCAPLRRASDAPSPRVRGGKRQTRRVVGAGAARPGTRGVVVVSRSPSRCRRSNRGSATEEERWEERGGGASRLRRSNRGAAEEERRRGAGARRSWRRSSDGIGMAASTRRLPTTAARRAVRLASPGERSPHRIPGSAPAEPLL